MFEMWEFCFAMHENKQVWDGKKCVTCPAPARKGRATSHEKKNASNFQTNLILKFWIFHFFVWRHIYSLKKDKQDKTKPSTIRAKGSLVTSAGRCRLHRTAELIGKVGKLVKAIVVFWVPGGFFEHSLWLEFIFYVLFWAWHSLLGYDSALSLIPDCFPANSMNPLWGFYTVGDAPHHWFAWLDHLWFPLFSPTARRWVPSIGCLQNAFSPFASSSLLCLSPSRLLCLLLGPMP